MTPSLSITLRTLTPLWTGGVDGACDRLHETGLIGSLRWWYEALVRGLGGDACDPTEHTCTFDEEKYRKSTAKEERQRLRDAGLCDACQLFGATGWARRFRVSIVDDSTQPIWKDPSPLNIRPPDRNRGWFLPPGRMGSVTLQITGENLSALAQLLLFIEQWGNLGAKPQLGYGVFRIENHADIEQIAQQNWQPLQSGRQQSSDLPDLRDFVFFCYTFRPAKTDWWTRVPGIERVAQKVQNLFQNYNIVPVSPALKNTWRFHHWQPAWGDPKVFFGQLHPERRGSRIAVSWAYRQSKEVWQVRGWAWLAGVKQRESVYDMITNQSVWRNILPEGALHVWPQANAMPTSEAIAQRLMEIKP